MLRSDPSPAGSRSLLHNAKSVLLVLSLLLATFGFFFFVWKLNGSGICSSLALSSVCTVYLHLAYCVLKGQLHETYNHRRFKFVFILAVVVAVSQLVASISFVALGSLNRHQRRNFGDSFYAAVIPSSLASVWAFLLAYECRGYMKEFTMEVTAQ